MTAGPVIRHLYGELVPYRRGLEIQRRLYDELLTGRREGSTSAPAGFIVILRHAPVITLGRSGGRENLLESVNALEKRGIEVVETDRGGDVTAHGPGQWTVYAIFNLAVFGKSVSAHIRRLEEVALRVMKGYGIDGFRIPGYSGAWTGAPGRERKLCAVGIYVRRWVTRHGIGFNVLPQPEIFNRIVPCGIKGKGVSSLSEELERLGKRPPGMNETAERISAAFEEVFDVRISADDKWDGKS